MIDYPRFSTVIFFVVAGCGADELDEPRRCPVRDDPSFELGTGADAFAPLVEGRDLPLIAGPQGGCHLWLSFRTDGFSESRFNVGYELIHADSMISLQRSEGSLRLSPAAGMPGRCEYVGFTAFVLEPWNVDDQLVRLGVEVTDDLGRSADTTRLIRVVWPPDAPGRRREDLCGRRLP
jgi:hypothetical protein